MKTLYVEVISSREATKRFAKAWKGASSSKAPETTVGVDSISELTALLSPKRLELIRHVAGSPGLSIRKLAKALSRDYKNVHTDVTDLEARHIIERDEGGLLMAPFDEIIIRAPLRRAA